jgi:hypothetical protein
MPISFINYIHTAPTSILIVGPPGVGKTVLLTQLPKPYIALTDANPKNAYSYVTREKLKADVEFDIPHIRPDGTLVPRSERYAAWSKCMTDAATAKLPDGTAKYETICTDSMTTWQDYVADQIRKENKKKIRGEAGAQTDDPISQPDYGALYGVAKQAVMNIKALGKRAVFTAHVESREDESGASKNLLKYISFPGKLKEQIAGLFDEVWFMDKRLVSGVTKIFLRTVPADFRENGLGLKSGVGIAHEWEVDYQKLREVV